MSETNPVKAAIFDAYGTLFDVHGPMQAAGASLDHSSLDHSSLGGASLGEKAAAFSHLWRKKQLDYTWLRSLMGRYVDFGRVTEDALDYALASFKIDNPPLREQLLRLYTTLTPYPDAASCLQRLKTSGLRTGILSNGSPSMLSTLVASSGLEGLLDYVLSVDTVQIYKPSPKVYNLGVEALGLEPSAIAFISANGWDCAGASAFGFQVVRVNRLGETDERLGFSPCTHVGDLEGAALEVLAMAER